MTKYKLPLGFRDYFGSVAQSKVQVENYLTALFATLGYSQIETPLLEDQTVFEQYSLTNEDVYRVLGPNGEVLVLRPDLTLPIARFLATTNIELPQKFAYIGSIFKRKRELMGFSNQEAQAGVELVGYASLKAELECIYLVNKLNTELLENKLYLELGHANFAQEVLAKLAISLQEQEAIKQALFTKDLPKYEQLIQAYSKQDLFSFLKLWPRLFGSLTEVAADLAKVKLPADLQAKCQTILNLGKLVAKLPNQEVRVDLTSSAPQDYYTGVTFKAYLPTESAYLVSGGRYDKLLNTFQAQQVPAVGMGIDLDLLAQLVIEKDQPGRQVKKQLYCETKQLKQALAIVEQTPDLTLSLATSLQAARLLAKKKGEKLQILTDKGELVDDIENSVG